MQNYYGDKAIVAQYAKDIILNSIKDCALTMTISPEKSGGYCVRTAIDGSLEDTVVQMVRYFLNKPTNTLPQNIPAG